MSHLSQRKEKNCLNCGTMVIGKYCHNCGQENIEPKESLWQLVSHFFNDITHFDGKFFSTLKDLLFKPGFLSKEYVKGRRASYLNPVRMYIFTSFIFFLIFFSVFHLTDSEMKNKGFIINGKTEQAINSMSPEEFNNFTKVFNGGTPMSREEFSRYKDSLNPLNGVTVFGEKSLYNNRVQYDSALKSGTVNDGWVKRNLTYKSIAINNKYHNQPAKLVTDFLNSLLHHFPQILFISLPLVALLLKLLYIRHKQFYYVAHAIFSLHFYIFVFIAMLLTICISRVEHVLKWNWLGYINGLVVITMIFYLYKAMRNFYQQRWAKTVLKFSIFSLSFLLLIVLLFTFFAFVSIFQI
jgi:hypothetical protein